MLFNKYFLILRSLFMSEKTEAKQELISSAFFCQLLSSTNITTFPQIEGEKWGLNKSYRIDSFNYMHI